MLAASLLMGCVPEKDCVRSRKSNTCSKTLDRNCTSRREPHRTMETLSNVGTENDSHRPSLNCTADKIEVDLDQLFWIYPPRFDRMRNDDIHALSESFTRALICANCHLTQGVAVAIVPDMKRCHGFTPRQNSEVIMHPSPRLQAINTRVKKSC